MLPSFDLTYSLPDAVLPQITGTERNGGLGRDALGVRE